MRHKDKELMQKIVDYIDYTYSITGRTPTYREIAKELFITVGCVSNYVKEMVEKGMLENSSGSRGLMTKKIQKLNTEIVNIPIVGSIVCGTPLLAEQNIDSYVPIPKSLLGNGNYFILVANGDSMIDANISNGDLVIVKVQETAEEGQIVVARIDDEATLKRFYKDNKRQQVRLHPENKNMSDMYFDNIAIQGIAVKVIKDLN